VSTARIAGRLRTHAAALRRHGAKNEILRIVERGYEIPYTTFRDVIQSNDNMITFDFQSGYYHCDVAPGDRTFLGFQFSSNFYVFAVLPFGLRDACYIFTELVKVPVRVLQSRGFRVLPYSDDISCLLQTMSQADADEARALLEELGFLSNLDKSVVGRS